MEQICLTSTARQRSREARRNGKRIGFVPTMGYLHEGHLSLVRTAIRQTDFCVVSVYVNPTQFGQGEDLASYPRDLEKDRCLLEAEGVDILFTPTDDQMYPGMDQTRVFVPKLANGLCGAFRPTHFEGVCRIVAKLFHVVEPDVAYFGQKDYQQAAILRKMAQDLLMPVEICILPTIRDNDGLAMSSRNIYLDPLERQAALSLHQGLQQGKGLVMRGENSPSRIEAAVREVIESNPLVQSVDYVAVVDPDGLQPCFFPLRLPILIAVAAHVGKARLIDNVYVTGDG